MSLSRIERIIKSNEFKQIIAEHTNKNYVINNLIKYMNDSDKIDKDVILSINRLRRFPYLLTGSETKIMQSFFEDLICADQVIDVSLWEKSKNNLYNLSDNALQIVEAVLMSTGHFQEALGVFKLFINILLHQAEKKTRMKVNYLWAQVYAPLFNISRSTVEISNPYLFPYNRMPFEVLKSIFITKDYSVKDITMDDTFSKFICGKKVLVIGPAPIKCYEDLVSYDTVIVINYRGNELYSERLKNAKNVVTYYNYEAEDIINNETKDMLNNVDYACFREIRYDYQYQILKQKKGRVYHCLDGMQLFGQPYILQNILFDLLCYAPKSIKLCCFTLYATSQSYGKGYVNKNNAIYKRYRAFAKHNIINQFMYLVTLFNLGLISTDPFLEKLITDGPEKYLYKINSLYVS